MIFSLVNAPSNTVLNAVSGDFSRHPRVADANSTNPITLTVAGNGAPGLSATQRFTIIVDPLTPPTVSSAPWINGQFALVVNGMTGPDYAVQTSTNLLDRNPVFTTNSPAMPFNRAETNSGNFPQSFYRIVVGPSLP